MPDTRVMQGSPDSPHILSTDAPASEVLARHHHDVEHGKRGTDGKELRHETHPPEPVAGGERRKIGAVQVDHASAGCQQARDDTKQGGFA